MPAAPRRRGRRGPAARHGCAGWTRAGTSRSSSTRGPSTAGSTSSWSDVRRRADERDHAPGTEGASGSPTNAPMLLDVRQDWETKLCRLPNAAAHPDRGDRAAGGRAEPDGRDRRLLPPGGAQRRGRRSILRDQLGFQNVQEPLGRPRPLGPHRRSVDATLLMADAAIRVERRGGVVRCTLDRPAAQPVRAGPHRRAARHVRRAGGGCHGAAWSCSPGAGRAFTAGMDVRVLRDLDAAGAET